jgi:hypothetical protein
MAPNELIARHCLSCHSRKVADKSPISRSVPLDLRDDVIKLSVPKNLTPVPREILTTSTHTHAIALGTLALATMALGLATSFPRRLVAGALLCIGAGLLADLGGQWIANVWNIGSASPRLGKAGVFVMLGGGGLFSLATAGVLVGALIDLCLPRRE